MIKTYKDGCWIFIYFPDRDFLRMLYKGIKKGFWPYGTDIGEAIIGSSSHEGKEQAQLYNWQSYYIDTALTKDWETAYEIAARHFNTEVPFRLSLSKTDSQAGGKNAKRSE